RPLRCWEVSNELTFGNLGVGKLSPKGVEDAADPTTGPVATLDRQSPATSKGIGHQSTLRFLSHVLGPNLRCCYQRKGEANWCSPLEAGQEEERPDRQYPSPNAFVRVEFVGSLVRSPTHPFRLGRQVLVIRVQVGSTPGTRRS